MDDHCLDVTKPHQAYMYGFIQTDGHMSKETRDRGRVTVEVSEQDRGVLETFATLIPYHSNISTRTRTTNFSEQTTTVTWRVYDKRFRDCLLSLGMPYGKKSAVIAPPSAEYAQVDYFRGVLDGDGSLGITGNSYPFIALVTASSVLAEAYIAFLSKLTGKTKKLALNTRDSIYNVTIYKEDAQLVASTLYYDGCLALTRKMQSAQRAQQWQRPESMRKRDFARKTWTPDEDEYILSHTMEESMEALGRTQRSIHVRLWRLRGSNNLRIISWNCNIALKQIPSFSRCILAPVASGMGLLRTILN